jgi:3-methyl-2-oxobutanoate hydroxymethyltransferase
MERKKLELYHLRARKKNSEKLTMLTAYDYPTAKLLDEEGIDILLVGDSVANVVLGHPDTVRVDMDAMIHHTKAVVRAVRYALVIGDMPFMSYNVSTAEAVRNAGRFLKEAGADAVKLEGGGHVVDTVRAIVRAGIPVCGHLGLTPQTASLIGGYRVQGRTSTDARQLVDHAEALEGAGASLLVLECVPQRLGALISRRLSIPVIGIGAGGDCDGQVLVLHDILGIQAGFTPKFVKRYADLDTQIREAAQAYRTDVVQAAFPTADQAFTMPDKSYEKLLGLLETEPSVQAAKDPAASHGVAAQSGASQDSQEVSTKKIKKKKTNKKK